MEEDSPAHRTKNGGEEEEGKGGGQPEVLSGSGGCGSLKLVIGPMFSGKTTYLLSTLEKARAIGLSVIYINNALDIRQETLAFSTHNGLIVEHKEYRKGGGGSSSLGVKPSKEDLELMGEESTGVSFPCIKVVDLGGPDMLREMEQYDMIGIDEAQFFSEEIVDFVETLASRMGKSVVVACLSGNVQRSVIGNWIPLIPKADNIKQLRAYCSHCSKKNHRVKAPFTIFRKCMRLGDDGVHGKDILCIGGKEIYSAVCRNCWVNLSKK